MLILNRSVVMRKHVFRVPNHVRHNQACSASQTRQGLEIAETKSSGTRLLFTI